MFRKVIGSIQTIILLISCVSGWQPAPSLAAEKTDTAKASGQVIVTIASPEKTTLAKKGETTFDSHVEVEKAWDFGDAKILGETAEQKEFLEDKTMYVSKVTSDEYSTSELIEKLDKHAYVVSVEPDYYQYKMALPNDAYVGSQWYLGNTVSTAKGINYTNYTQKAAKTPVVAVVDTGIDYTHEDLKDRMWVNTYSSLKGKYGYDFGDYDNDPMDEDKEGHGTHCAGSIGAMRNNSTGIAGIASNVKLMALKVFNYEDKMSNSSIIAAFNYIYKAQKLGVPVKAVNCSWGGGTSSSTMETLINKIGAKGALFIFAAGNEAIDHNSDKTTCPYDMKSNYIVTVGASDTKDMPATFSDYGASTVDLFAPGTMILSTASNNTFYPSPYTAAQKQTHCSYFNDASLAPTNLYTPADFDVSSGTYLTYNLSHSTEDAYAKSGNGSYRLDITSIRKNGATLALLMDVTDLNLNSSEFYYLSYDLGNYKNGQIQWDPYETTATSSHFAERDGRKYMMLLTLSGSFDNISSVFIDNIAISTASPYLDSFLKYRTTSGTSMAAPIVTGAVAVLANMFPSDTAAQRKERLLSSVRTSTHFVGKCRTKGILDMSKFATSKVTPIYKVTKVTLNKKKAKLKVKKKLKLKATVKPTNATNKKVKWYSSNKKYATVTQKGVVKAKKKGIGKTVKIYAKATDGSGKKSYCKVKIKK